MAMKLTEAEKRADSQLRSFNRQLEKSIRQLGETHPVTQNLISTARSIFGDNGTKYMVDKTTGLAILQVSRTRTALQTATTKSIQYIDGKNKSVTPLERLAQTTQYTDRTNKTRYKSMFDVSKAYSNAVGKAKMEIQSNIPTSVLNEIKKARTISDKNKILSDYVNSATTTERVRTYLELDAVMGEIFDKYHEEMNLENPNEDLEYLKSLAEDYNQSRGAKDPNQILKDAVVQRTIIDNLLQQQKETNQIAIGFLSDLDDIL